MASPSLTELLKRWEQAFARGRDLSPEELCPGVPELQKALRAAIQQKRAQAMEQGPTIGFSPKNRAVGQQDEQTTTFHPGHDEAQPGEAEKLEQTVASGESTVGPGRRERSAQADKPKSTIPSPPGYTILGELGRGGMGVVYKARQEGLNRLCAIKMVLMGDHASPDELARFRTEAEAIARLQHPNIIQVFEIGTLGDKPFLSLEFCSAGSLEKLLDTRVLAPREAAQIVKILAEAIQVAHDANILHRDLKPANILLAETTEKTSSNRSTEISQFSQVEGATDASGTFVRMVPKITDFGLAKKMDEAGQTLSGVIVGTPSFMAPEQATGQKVGPLVDVYSLGAILYECLSGRPPFQAANSYETLMQVIHDDPIPPMRLNPKIPLDLDTITLKCLQKDTRKRYATAADLAADLDRWLQGQPIEARPVGMVERAGKWVRRHKLVSALSALALLSLVGGVVASLWLAAWAMTEAQAARTAVKTAMDAELTAKWERDRVEWLLYGTRLAESQIAFDKENGSQAIQVLAGVRPELRGWEHRHLWTRFTSPQTFWGHADDVLGAVYSPDGRRLITGSWDETAKVWDVESGSLLLTLKGQPGEILCVAISPDGKRIATGRKAGMGQKGRIQIWDAEAAHGKMLFTCEGHSGSVISIAFSPDGKRLASGGEDATVRLWEIEGVPGKNLATYKAHEKAVNSVAFHPEGKWLLSGSDDQTAKIWDTSSSMAGTPLFTTPDQEIGVSCVAVSPDGTRFLTAYRDANNLRQRGMVKIWEREKQGPGGAPWVGKIVIEGHTGCINSVAFSPDGQRVITGSWDYTAKIWDLAPLRDLKPAHLKLTLVGHMNSIVSVAFSPDGMRILTGSRDNSAKIWDARFGQKVLELRNHDSRITAVAFRPDGKRIASGSADQMIQVCDPGPPGNQSPGEPIHTLKGHTGSISSVVFSPDGSRLISGSADKTVRIWDVAEDPKEPASRLKQTLEGHADEVTSVAISPDGRWIASGSKDCGIHLWDAQTGKLQTRLSGLSEDKKDIVTCVAISPDGEWLASSRGDQTVQIWRFNDLIQGATAEPALTIPKDGVTFKSIAFSPDSKRLLGGSMDYDTQNRGLPAKAKVWDVWTGKEILDLEGHVEPIFTVAFSPDGKRILTGTGDMFNPNNPSLVRIWDAETGLELLWLKGFLDNVLCVTFSPDGRRILAGGGDTQYLNKRGQVILWDVVREQDMIILGGHTDLVRQVSFSEDGRYVYGKGKDNNQTVWSIQKRKPVKAPGLPPESFVDQAESPDGKYTAVMQGESVVLLDNALYKQQNRWPLPDSRERKKYHEMEAEKFEQEKNGFAAAFHLGRLLKLDPDNAVLRNRLRQAETMPTTASSPPTR